MAARWEARARQVRGAATVALWWIVGVALCVLPVLVLIALVALAELIAR